MSGQAEVGSGPGAANQAPARLVGFGHSHLSCFLRAWQTRRRENRMGGERMHFVRLGHQQFQPNFVQAEDGRRPNPDLDKRIRHILRRERPKAVFCVLMGNEYNSIAMVRHPEPYDVAWPDEPPADPEARLIPRAMMRAQLADLAALNALMLWRAIAAASSVPVLLAPPPPPIPDEDHIRAHPGKFGTLVQTHGLNPAPMRRRMWRLYCEVLEEAVAGSATTFVDLPPEIFEDGYLARRFWQGDPTHANEAYGQIMLDRMLALSGG